MNVVRSRGLFAFPADPVGLVVAPLRAHGPRQQAGDRGEVTLLPDALERLVSWPQLALRGDGIVGEPDESEVDGMEPDRVTELGHRDTPACDELLCFLDAALHRLGIRKHAEDGRFEDRVTSGVREQRLAAGGDVHRRHRPEHHGDAEPFDDLAQFEQVAGEAPVLERTLGSLGARTSVAAR